MQLLNRLRMRLSCSVSVGLRRKSGDYTCGRASRGFVGISRVSGAKNGEQTAAFYLLVQYQSKKSERFRVGKGLIQSLLKACVRAGKATIMLTEPPVNIFISEADPQKLSIFMASLQQVADRNVLDKKLSLNLWEENSSQSEIASMQTRKMHIFRRQDYPRAETTATFSDSLRELRITGVGLKSVDFRWFALVNLIQLDLSNNLLGQMRNSELEWRKFTSIRKLRKLEELDLSQNELYALPQSFVDALPLSLGSLNLSSNHLIELPERICHLENLHTLILDYNNLEELPEDLCMLRRLRVLSAEHNQLYTLPSPLFSRQNYRRFTRLDLSANPALTRVYQRRRLLSFNANIPNLRQFAAAALLNSDIPSLLEEDTLPRTVAHEMRGWLRRCAVCHRLFPQLEFSFVSNYVTLQMNLFVSDVYSGPSTIHVERFFCQKCAK